MLPDKAAAVDASYVRGPASKVAASMSSAASLHVDHVRMAPHLSFFLSCNNRLIQNQEDAFKSIL